MVPTHLHFTSRVPMMLPSAEDAISRHRMVGMLRRPMEDTSPGASSHTRPHSDMVTVIISAR